jgi:hypothetical protein
MRYAKLRFSQREFWRRSKISFTIALLINSITIMDATAEIKKEKMAALPNKAKAELACVDVQSVTIADPARAIKKLTAPKKLPAAIKCNVLVVGGGMGGVACAIQAAEAGLSVCLTEETDWLGGQMTSQGVSALDENYLVETSGASLRYQKFRTAIRQHYRLQHRLSTDAAKENYLNPGGCWVTRLSFEPKVAVRKLGEILAPLCAEADLKVQYRLKPIEVQVEGERIQTVTMIDLESGKPVVFKPQICIDATELGDLIALSGAEYRSGAESKSETNEPHAPEVANRENVQDFTYPFVLELRPGESHVIDKPPHYDQFVAKEKFSFQGYKMFETTTRNDFDSTLTFRLPFWEYRRLIQKAKFADSGFEHDLAMINWDSNDLRGENIIDKPPETEAERLALGKALSLGFLYWLQTEAPRDDEGVGYPELLLRTDIMGTTDGLSKYPYIRESRRIVAKQIVVEQDIASAANSGARAKAFSDSVGIGLYPIDIHGEQDVPGAAQPTNPFQLPLGSLIPMKMKNLVPACKNIGVTHVTNGAFRLHPIEWAIGEAAGLLASFAIANNKDIDKIWDNKKHYRKIQQMLVEQGSPIYWFDDVPCEHPDFAAIQFLAITGIMPGAHANLSFHPNEPIARQDAAVALAAMFDLMGKTNADKAPSPDVSADDPHAPAINACLRKKLFVLRDDGTFAARDHFTKLDLLQICQILQLPTDSLIAMNDEILRKEFAAWAYTIASGEDRIGRL